MTQNSIRYMSMSSSFKTRAAGQAKLKQFFKYTHPDLFGGAPESVKEKNLRSIQELNEYLTNVSNPLYQNSLDARNLTFFVKSSGTHTGKSEENFRKFSIELLSLKSQVSADTKSMHYSNTVDSLIAALESKLGDDDKDYN